MPQSGVCTLSNVIDANVSWVSMDTDSGTKGESHEPPQLPPVRRLHHDDAEASSITATEDWYETERLTGQITGGARTASPTGQPASAQTQAPAVLDWRHAETPTPATVVERFERSLDARRHRHRHKTADPRGTDALAQAPASEAKNAVLAALNHAAPPDAPKDDEPAADQIRVAQPNVQRIGLRGDADLALQNPSPGSAPLVGAHGRKRGHRTRLRAGVILSAVVLSVAVSVIGIMSGVNRPAAKPPHANVEAATPKPDNGLHLNANTVLSALGRLEHQARRTRRLHRPTQAHPNLRHKTSAHTRSTRRRLAVSRSASPPPTVAPTTAPRGSSYAGSSSSSSSSPTYNPRAATTQSAPAATTSTPQPAGPSGPGGTVGTNCNPKCS